MAEKNLGNGMEELVQKTDAIKNGTGAFLDRVLNNRRMERYHYPEHVEPDTALHDEVVSYAQAHPEEVEKFGNLDDFAEHYIANIKPNLKMMRVKETLRELPRKEEPLEKIETPAKSVETKKVTVEEFLDRLTRK